MGWPGLTAGAPLPQEQIRITLESLLTLTFPLNLASNICNKAPTAWQAGCVPSRGQGSQQDGCNLPLRRLAGVNAVPHDPLIVHKPPHRITRAARIPS